MQQALLEQGKIGESKHEAKAATGAKAPNGIYSFRTMETYLYQGCKFAKWAKAEHGCKTLEQAKPYAKEYLEHGIARSLSASTLSTQRAAICKLYRISADDVDIKLPARNRRDITRSRAAATNDKHFSVKNNAGIIAFCRATGLRRHELASLRQNQICTKAGGRVELQNVKGKGGKIRNIAVISGMEAAVIKYADAASQERVFRKVPQNMDVHSYRREYAAEMYRTQQRHLQRTEGRVLEKLPSSELYHCRKDKAGIVYDKRIMRYVSRQLGHNRISVIAGHYLG